tara:strand:+ start:47 stop:1009 length:963 start_codon:yes stop_codon:yes gene_type:complete
MGKMKTRELVHERRMIPPGELTYKVDGVPVFYSPRHVFKTSGAQAPIKWRFWTTEPKNSKGWWLPEFPKEENGIKKRDVLLNIIDDVYIHDCYDFRNWKPNRSPKWIVDLGANIGAFTKMAAEKYPNAKILSFELMRSIYDLLETNTKDFPNVIARNTAVIGKNKPVSVLPTIRDLNLGGTKLLYSGDSSYISESRFAHRWKRADWDPDYDKHYEENKQKFNEQNISHLNMKQIFEIWGIDKIDFLKMDIEGSEHEIIPHLMECGLLDKIDHIALEIHGAGEREYWDIKNTLEEKYGAIRYKTDSDPNISVENIWIVSKT